MKKRIKKALVRYGVVGFTLEAFKRLFLKLTIPFAYIFSFAKLFFLQKKNKKELLKMVYSFPIGGKYGILEPMQVKSEISDLLDIIEKNKPSSILEIGTANGGTLLLFTKLSSKDAQIISIDLPGGRFGGGYSKLRIPLYKLFAKNNKKISLLRLDSHDNKTKEKVEDILDNKKLDFLFIDGDHTYEGVKRDFELYSPLVKEGGVIAFHDIVLGNEKNVGGVPRFWQEVKQYYHVNEFIEDLDQGGYGIGVIHF
jgi:predicted O-methyltransferase YrrM